MKAPYMMLTLLILRPFAPSKDIEVFLRPLVDELKELWNHHQRIEVQVAGNTEDPLSDLGNAVVRGK